MNQVYRFQEYTFHSETGELFQRDESGHGRTDRLQPQPAKLLRLLLDNFPDAVSREQIRTAIWPEVEVDYEGSIHFCIRQVRAALNDSASEPRFIETIPRRGYRWMVEWDQNNSNATIAGSRNRSEIAPSPTEKPKKASWLMTGTRLLVVSISLLLLASIFLYPIFFPSKDQPSSPPPTAKVRLGIMPFQPNDSLNPFFGNDIAYDLVEALSNLPTPEPGAKRFEVIGPTTTKSYSDRPISELAQDFQLDVVLNGRFLGEDRNLDLLAEVIRCGDGAHVWVQSYSPEADRKKLAKEVALALVREYGK